MIRSDYGNNLSRLEKRPSGMLCQKKRFHRVALQSLTVVQLNDACALEGTFSFMTEIADKLLTVSKQGD